MLEAYLIGRQFIFFFSYVVDLFHCYSFLLALLSDHFRFATVVQHFSFRPVKNFCVDFDDNYKIATGFLCTKREGKNHKIKQNVQKVFAMFNFNEKNIHFNMERFHHNELRNFHF